METMTDKIQEIEKEYSAVLELAKTEQALEQVRVAFLGRSGKIADLMTQLKALSLEEKRVFGPALNEFKKSAEERFAQRLAQLEQTQSVMALNRQANFDVTAYKKAGLPSTLHVYTHIQEQLEDIFISMGYQIADGPEIETEYYNFEALNVPADHPARDMQDTFWLTIPKLLLRTHTSPVQIRAMQQYGAPLAVAALGRTYRQEATDMTHDFMFSQIEGLLVDKNISMANLVATAKAFLQAFFEKKDLKIRLRPGYFPFVEPGVEIDASCPFCTEGCSACKRTTWIELLGAGLVHPNVLQCGGIDSKKYSGFAFGAGLERLAMVKYGINDIRLFHSSKIPFLDQF